MGWKKKKKKKKKNTWYQLGYTMHSARQHAPTSWDAFSELIFLQYKQGRQAGRLLM